jgi:hypothetical protein
MLTAMQQLIKAVAGLTGLSDDNRLLRARRKRRVRIGLKSQEWLREVDAETLDSYGKFNEKSVVKQVQALQMGANFEQFSDEESDDNDRDGDAEDEDDEDGSWEDSTGDDENESDQGDKEDAMEAESVDSRSATCGLNASSSLCSDSPSGTSV